MIAQKNRLIIITIVYWFLLIYIVAALVWWFIALENQNRQMFNYKLSELIPADPLFNAKRQDLLSEKKEKVRYIFLRALLSWRLSFPFRPSFTARCADRSLYSNSRKIS